MTQSLPSLPSWRDSAHVWILLIVILLAGGGLLHARRKMIPQDFGVRGPFRDAALKEIGERRVLLQSDATCLECHHEVAEERADSLHKNVGCMHCHGAGGEHVRIARLAAQDGTTAIPPAADWDGHLTTTIDLFSTKDRAICLSCHEAVVGMPEDFKKIDVDQHLEEQGAESPESRTVCLDCHGWHNTAPQ